MEVYWGWLLDFNGENISKQLKKKNEKFYCSSNRYFLKDFLKIMKVSEFLIFAGKSSQIFEPVYWIDFLPVVELNENLGGWIVLRLLRP